MGQWRYPQRGLPHKYVTLFRTSISLFLHGLGYLDGLGDAVEQGLVKAVGVSNYSGCCLTLVFLWYDSTRASLAAVTAARWAVILVGHRRRLRVATAAWHADGLVAWRQLARWMPVLPAPPRRRRSSALPAKEYQLRTKQGPPRAIREEMGNRGCLRSCAMPPSLLPVHEGRRSAAPNCVHGPVHCCLAFY